MAKVTTIANKYVTNVEYQKKYADHVEVSMREEFYNQIDPRRRQERMDFNLMNEDYNAVANLSPVAMHKEVPREQWSPLTGVLHEALVGE